MDFQTLQSGVSTSWEISLPQYLAADGWGLKYYLRGPSSLDITATGTGDPYLLSILPSDELIKGDYTWQSFVTNTNTDARYLIGSGKVTVLADISLEDGPLDNRSQTKIIIDAIDACVLKVASQEQLMLTIGSLQLQYHSPESLAKARSYYATLYAREQAAEAANATGNNTGFGRNIYTRFNSPR